MKNIAKRLLSLLVVTMILAVPVFAFAGPETPGELISNNSVELLVGALTLIVSYFSGAFPILKRIKPALIRTAVVSAIILIGALQFKLGFLSAESMQFFFDNYLPNFAYTGLVYQFLKFLLPLIGIKFNSVPAKAA